MPLVNKIKEFIDRRGITPYRFAKEVGITTNTVYPLYNNPNQRMGVLVLEKICDVYKVQPSEIIGWVDSDEGEEIKKKR